MKVTVVGQKGDGPIVHRTVTPFEFFRAWGPFGPVVWKARRETLLIDGHKIRVVLHD